jgi:stage III sporulation protein AH
MAIGKRQLVLAALVVALGAAVYLNWSLSGNQLSAADATASGTLGAAQLVNQSAGSKVTSGSKTASSNTSAVATNAKANECFATACLTRQKARDTSTELLQKAIANLKSTDSAKKDAEQQLAVIAQNIIKENQIESLVKAKGFVDCVAFLQDGGCNVVVQKTNGIQANDTVTIKDIVNNTAGISYDKIKIVEAK